MGARVRRHRLTVVMLVVLVWTLVGSVVTPDALRPGASAAPGAEGDPPPPQDVPDPIPWKESSTARLTGSEGLAKPKAVFPKSATWDITLGDTAKTAALDEADARELGVESVADLPVRVRAKRGGLRGEELRVQVHGRDVARKVGASGFVFTLSDVAARGGGDGVLRRTADAGALPAELEIDYSGFAEAYDTGYGSRLKAVVVPECALKARVPAGCPKTGVPLPTRNDLEGKRLVVDVADLARLAVSNPSTAAVLGLSEEAAKSLGAAAAERSGGADQVSDSSVTVALVSSTSSETTNYQATPLSVTGSWNVSSGTGEFGYSYPFGVPAPGAGSAPTVALGYSSAAVDGMTFASNTQGTPSGMGWSDFANAFIERSYEPCYMGPLTGLADLCWKSDNATISLNGVSGPLIPVDNERTQWRVKSDPGWKIERLTGAPHTNIHDKQYWRVTGPDGTLYYFGYGHMPGRPTNSILSVPVVSDNGGEPCAPGCEQGWRWYLDRVVDPDGNVASYVYQRETNYFHSPLADLPGGDGRNRAYHRAAVLSEIVYGGRGWNSSQYSARVLFGTESRCGFLVVACPPATSGNAGSFFDVPNDLICDSPTASCTVNSPSFFSGLRYSYVQTQVRIGGKWTDAGRYNINHEWPKDDENGDGRPDGVAKKLRVKDILQVGFAFKDADGDGDADSFDVPYEPTRFGYAFMDNRVDHEGNIPRAMRHNRLNKVTNPFGGVTEISYTRNRRCFAADESVTDPHWDQNTKDCFPQWYKDSGSTHIGLALFEKYLVGTVTEKPGQGSPDMVTRYTYGGNAAWAYDPNTFARGDQDQYGFAVWRGYDTITVANGASKSRSRLYRGLHGDYALEQNEGGNWEAVRGARRQDVLTFGGSVKPDHAALAGQALEEQQLGVVEGQADQPVESKLNEYEQVVTVRGASLQPAFAFDATWVGLKSTTTRVHTSLTQYKERRSVVRYNTDIQPPHSRPFQPLSTLEEGWRDVEGDERCSVTEFAEDPTRWMFAYPAVNKLVAGGCDSTEVLSMSQTYYDGSTTLKALPGRGNPTMRRTLVEDGRWSTSRTEFDDLGRPVTAVDPNGNATTTAYLVAGGGWAGDIPTKTTVRNALGHVAETEFHPELGLPRREKGVNGNVTEYSYDSVGRPTAVWLPDAPIAFAEPSWRYSYDIPNRAVRTRTLTSQARTGDTVTFDDTWVIYDGFMRPRQTQTVSPVTTNALVSETTYDDRGLVRDQTVEQVQPGAPGTYRPGGNGWANRTRTVHDELGRTVRAEWWRGAEMARATTTAYGLDMVTVTGPDGRQVRERIDGLGRKTKVEESDGQDGWVSSSYTYDLADRLLTVTDPAGNVTSYRSNKVGWRTGQDDPDRGTASFTYDDAGQQVSATDALGQTVHSVYDDLGRRVEVRKDSPSGQLLASWQYDTAPGGVGALHKELSYDATGVWTSEALGYDGKGRPTGSRLTVPGGLAGLSGSYTVTQTYNRSDQTIDVNLPALGGLPAETLTTTYNGLGMPTKLSGLEPYVQNVTYDDRGRRTFANMGPTVYADRVMKGKRWHYDADQRMNQVETFLRTTDPNVASNLVYRWELKFDAAGNLVERDVPAYHGQSWRECYVHDARHRLTDAFSTTRSLTCADADQPAERGIGDQPFQRVYGYHPDGRLHVRSDVINPDWADLDLYEYPAAGEDRPHAPTQVKDLLAESGDTYTWDANGNLTERTVDGATETFAWDTLHRLTSVSGPSDTTNFVYSASGERLLRRAGGQSTLYWAGHEVTVAGDGSVVKSARPYSFGGELIAVRSTRGVEYVDADAAGSVEQSAASGAPQPTTTRLQDPYGAKRHQAGAEPASDRGFVGRIEDPSTSLSYLGARYYDTTIGIFISTDPLYDTTNVKSLNPYQYGFNNPTTFSDPAGTMSSYTHGLEKQNAALKAANKQLTDIIKQQGSAIAQLQHVIREQQRHINELYTHISSLEAIIREQQAYITNLEARVRHLQRQVAYWKGQAMYWRRQAHYWRGQAMYWRGQAVYWQGRADFWKGRAEFYRARGDYWRDRSHDLLGSIRKLRTENEGLQSSNSQLRSSNRGLESALEEAESGGGGGGGGGGGCGWGWSGVANCLQTGGHVLRATVNLPRTTVAATAAYATGGSCDMRSGLMVSCHGVPDWLDGQRGGFTFGNTYLTSGGRPSDTLMRHESSHGTQWALFGDRFGPLYLVDAGQDALRGGGGCHQVFEQWAGLEGGGYDC